MTSKFYITTPIYYVNDRPHIGHVYTTTMADVIARYRRLRGDKVFFLTGTDEHAAKVIDAAKERGLTPLAWADQNAQAFRETFAKLAVTNDDFIRTTEERHKDKVCAYVTQLISSGDVYEGEYEGWYDAGQEEYVTDNKAEEYGHTSPFNGKPLVRKKEKNYFFRLSRYQDELLNLLKDRRQFDVRPDARRNEVISRIEMGLNDVPISRTGALGWGIQIPNDPQQTVYVWIDALFNYLSTVDAPERQKFWPADVHLIAKDILWFHAVIWPALLLALQRPLPRLVYAHSFWIAEGQKMSKSLGNFVDLEKIDHYVGNFSLDALRYFLCTQGPWGTDDSDFAEAKFIAVYDTDLANQYGNLLNRVSGLLKRYFDGRIPQRADFPKDEFVDTPEKMVESAHRCLADLDIRGAIEQVTAFVDQLNKFMERRAPWKVAKTDLRAAGEILYVAAEGLRLCTYLLQPVMPSKTKQVLEILGAENSKDTWGELSPGTQLKEHGPLFPRHSD